MWSLKEFKRFCSDHSELDAIIVYVEEAHPIDGWQFNTPGQYQINQPRKFSERLNCAKHLATVLRQEHKFEPKIFVDGMNNEISSLFAAFPERLVLLRDNTVEFIGGPGPESYSIQELRDFVTKMS